MLAPLIINRGIEDYQTTWQAMRYFTDHRANDTADEVWFVEHPPVFTLGQNGKSEHILNPREIPIIQTDRGGQVTYHGPGQLVCYVLFDLKRYQLGVRQLVTLLERSIILLLKKFNVTAISRADAPGVYIGQAKIASVGLRIRKGCSYHGLSLNVNMDLTPFSYINPCGMMNLKMTQLSEHTPIRSIAEAQKEISEILLKELSFTSRSTCQIQTILT